MNYLLLIPAFNEEGAIAGVVREAREVLGPVPVLVADDCSTDSTAGRAREAGAQVVSLPHHLGLGGCVQAGYRLAHELVLRIQLREAVSLHAECARRALGPVQVHPLSTR